MFYVKKHKQDENSINIRTSHDLASIGQKLMKDKDTDIIIKSDTYNPLKEHGIDKLEEHTELIGNGIFEAKINYSKIRKKQLIDFIKKHKKQMKY